ncbi:hypothetical protein ACKWTF_011040 [Chironomus riparius]
MSEAVFWILATLVSFACVITIFGFIAVYDRRKKKRISATLNNEQSSIEPNFPATVQISYQHSNTNSSPYPTVNSASVPITQIKSKH